MIRYIWKKASFGLSTSCSHTVLNVGRSMYFRTNNNFEWNKYSSKMVLNNNKVWRRHLSHASEQSVGFLIRIISHCNYCKC